MLGDKLKEFRFLRRSVEGGQAIKGRSSGRRTVDFPTRTRV